MTLPTPARPDPELALGRRQASRLSCTLGVEIKQSATAWQRALLRDVSATGFKAVAPTQSAGSDSLWLRLPGLDPLAASVRWRDGAVIGCRFLYPLDRPTLDRIEAILERASVAAEPVPA